MLKNLFNRKIFKKGDLFWFSLVSLFFTKMITLFTQNKVVKKNFF